MPEFPDDITAPRDRPGYEVLQEIFDDQGKVRIFLQDLIRDLDLAHRRIDELVQEVRRLDDRDQDYRYD